MTTCDIQYTKLFSFVKDINGTFVSVGSWSGRCEKYLENRGKTVICIDPRTSELDKYTKTEFVRKPDYPFVSELIRKDSNIVTNCNLLIVYPLPDYSVYDVKSIRELRPSTITICCSRDGKSGSWLLHRFLRRVGVPTIAKLQTDMRYSIDKNICVIDDEYEITKLFQKKNTILVVLTRKVLCENPRNISFPKDQEEAVCIGEDNIKRSFLNTLVIIKSLQK